MTGRPTDLINGVPRDLWGLWCEHGKHVGIADPESTSDYPHAVPADPWPCAICTLDGLMEKLRQQEADHWQEKWSEWRDSQ